MIKPFIKKRIIAPISISAVSKIVQSEPVFKEFWEYSLELFPDLKAHFNVPIDDKETEYRTRLLVVAETSFIQNEIDAIIAEKGECSYADVGDSDGSVRLILKKYFYGKKLNSVGINLQKSAVEKIRSIGLDAICADAQTLGELGLNYDVVSVFETLEHLPNPIGFLNSLQSVVNKRLIVSVPFIRRSRIGLVYLSDKWPEDNKPTIENTHIFELSPTDWKKIFHHTGWKVNKEMKLMMFPSIGISRFLLQPYWRFVSFEGFWFVSLCKDDTYTSRYTIE